MSRCVIPLGRILGVQVRVHLVFLAVLALLLLRAWQTGGAERTVLWLALLLPALGFLLLHELGHAVAARRLGIPVGEVLLGPFVNLASLAREPDRPSEELRIAAAGPAVNGVLAALLAGAAVLAGRFELPESSLRWLRLLAALNLVLCLGNLVPAFPLDGGRILRALLSMRLPLLVATRAAVRVGNTLLLAFPVLSLLHPAVRRSPTLLAALLLVAVVLHRMGRREEHRAILRELELQAATEGSDVDPALRERLAPAPRPPDGWRPLPPGQYRHWKELCEAAWQRRQDPPA